MASRLLAEARFRHAFFVRTGGVSSGPFASLSFSVAAGDSRTNVQRNLERAARILGVPAEQVYFLSQVHGRQVHELAGLPQAESVQQQEGDALVSRRPDLACGVRTADCVPVLLADRSSGAVGAVHAGWRGLVRGVIAAAVTRLRQLAGAEADLIAAVGPHITVRAFEVSDQVASELAAAAGDEAVVHRGFGAKPHVDLRRVAHLLLLQQGLAEACIDHVDGCTYGDPARYFSYRRDGARSGRHLSAIVARRLPGSH